MEATGVYLDDIHARTWSLDRKGRNLRGGGGLCDGGGPLAVTLADLCGSGILDIRLRPDFMTRADVSTRGVFSRTRLLVAVAVFLALGAMFRYPGGTALDHSSSGY